MMGSYDGEELCELIGIYIQSLLTNIISKDKMGLYRDDGLFILRRKNKQKQIEYEGKLWVFSKTSTLKLKFLSI